MSAYIGRFAPSPTGPLHAGSMVAALASWLDARAHGGQWLIRMEDIDPPRCQPGADQQILHQLAACGLHSDQAVVWQSARHGLYQQALNDLVSRQLAYPCGCTRKDIEAAWQHLGMHHERHVERPYPGLCRHDLQGKTARARRFALCDLLQSTQSNWPSEPDYQWFIAINTGVDIDVDTAPRLNGPVLHWFDRRLGAQQQDLPASAGDFILQRADGLWAYQLAVVVDDAAQGISHIVRGEDLTDNTPRQLLLQQALKLPAPHYLHTPLVRMANGEKLSKQHGAAAVAVHEPLAVLSEAAAHLGLPALVRPGTTLGEALAYWVKSWQQLYNGDFAP